MNLQQILANVKHWQTTLLGAAVVAAGLIQSPTVQTIAGLNPKVAQVVGVVGSVVAGAVAVLGMGGKVLNEIEPAPAVEPPKQ